MSLDSPVNDSKKRWSQPKTVRQFTSQVNAVATRLLNGEIEVDQAKAYSALARTIAQTVTAEVQRARALKRVPDLNFADIDVPDSEGEEIE